CYAADRTGHMILQTLYQQCVKHGVEFYNEFYVLDIIMTEVDGVKRPAGVVSYELATGEIHIFQAKSIVFATGGVGKVFKTTSNAHTLTGDGMAVTYNRGIPLEDMEFFQFHPTGLAGLGILLSEAARGEGGILRNSEGERFMERYAPTIKDIAPRPTAPSPTRPTWSRGARTSPCSPAPPSAWSPTPRRFRSSRPRPTPWAASRRPSRPRSSPPAITSSPASTPPANAPVCPCTVRI